MKRRICVLMFLIFTAMLLFSGAMLLRDKYRSECEKEANFLLAQEIRKAKGMGEQGSAQGISEGKGGDAEGSSAEEPIEEELPILPEYEELWGQNHDLAGWLTIEDLGIDYAVMYTPDEPEYYLHRGFDGGEAKSGSLFIGEGWVADGGNTIIYGHHMKDGTMFGKLGKYSSESYAREHPSFTFDTLTEKGEYQVMAAFYSRIYGLEEKDVFRYYWYTDLRSPGRFEEYVGKVKEASLYDIGVEAAYGDSLLTLSTCSYHEKEGRFVVVAKRLDEENKKK